MTQKIRELVDKQRKNCLRPECSKNECKVELQLAHITIEKLCDVVDGVKKDQEDYPNYAETMGTFNAFKALKEWEDSL